MLKTEMRNPNTMNIDKMDKVSVLRIINEENMNAVKSVETEIEKIAKVCGKAEECLNNGGRMFYVGAGTSGRLGVIDAAECPPTFGISHDKIIGIIAGGEKSMTIAAEGVEDSREAGIEDLLKYNIDSKDLVIGISAAGGAEYVQGALEAAKKKGCYTVSITSNENSPITKMSDISIVTDTGAEVITGSTRMKAGTAQKIVLNMISTCTMIATGKVYENLMINLKPSNKKLRKRMIGIVCELKQCSEDEAVTALENSGWDIRKAVSDEPEN